MESLFFPFLFLVLIGGVIFFIFSSKKNKENSPVSHINFKNLSNPANHSNSDPIVEIKNPTKKEQKEKESVTKLKKTNEQGKSSEKLPFNPTQEQKAQIKNKKNLKGRRMKKKLVSWYKKLVGFIVSLKPQKQPKKIPLAPPPPTDIDNNRIKFELALYLKSKKGNIDTEKLLHIINDYDFLLIHKIGYYRGPLVIQQENGEPINRMNISHVASSLIKIHLESQDVEDENEFSETMGIISAMAKKLDCQILNFKKEPATQEDLIDIEGAIFNS